ncbi:Methyl-accepting chemotaxis protein PctA [compost metagenome]
MVRGDLYIGHAVTILNSLDLKGMGHAFLVSGRADILMHPDSGLVEKPPAEIYPIFKNFTDWRLQEVC